MNKETKYNTYHNLLSAENEKFNLTAIKSRGAVKLLHFADSRSAQSFFAQGSDVLDIGSGAGFPGLVLAIERPDVRFTLLEASRKKADFLRLVVSQLELANASVQNARAEDYAQLQRESFDYVVSRAVARLPLLLEYALPFLKLNGKFFAYKATDAEIEIAEAKNALLILGGEVIALHKYSIDDAQTKRALIEIEKVHKTPDKYPRAKAHKKPL